MVYGYERVSTTEQNLGRQRERLLQAGVEAEHIFSDKISGKDMNRPNLKNLLSHLREGDELVVLSLDRLGRNSRDIITLVDNLRSKRIKLRLLDMDIDSDSPVGKLIIAIMAELAEVERLNILEHQRQGIELAKAEGRKNGRPRKELDEKEFNRIYEKYLRNEISVTDAAKLLCISRATFYRRVEEFEGKRQTEEKV